MKKPKKPIGKIFNDPKSQKKINEWLKKQGISRDQFESEDDFLEAVSKRLSES
jgi:TusA-related sulfurtransferase